MRGLVLCVLMAAALTSCRGTPTRCDDGIDNDLDGLTDQADPGCAANDGRDESPDIPHCRDGIDNDGDGLSDYGAGPTNDPGCDAPDDFDEQDPVRACNDGVDNDDDGLTDFVEDPGCDSSVDDDEYNPPACDDGI